MPNWKKVANDMATIIEGLAQETSSRRGTGNRRSALAQKRTGNRKQCLFWDCNTPIPSNYFLCRDHFKGYQENAVDECPGCNRAKDSQYDMCLDCYNSRPKQQYRNGNARGKTNAASYKWYKKEHSPAWDKGDAAANEFFVYILKLDGGRFYAGQTRELRERLSEHRDGNTKSTAGKNPKLIWFATLSTRDAATSAEVELKKLIDSNPREIRRMVVSFQDLIRELDYS